MECGGTIIYIRDDFTSKSRKDLDDMLYKQSELESTFIEIIVPKEKNIVCGCIYKHPFMEANEFNEKFFLPLLHKLSKENKVLFLMGDFNINLLNINDDNDVTDFFDIIASNLLIPFIIHQT